ncbi:hypothetical protein C3L33_10267, partial [Rhododendron williamsianum]
MKQSESPAKLGSNGRTIKMVPTSEVMKRKTPSLDNADVVNGSKRVVNGSNRVVNGSIGVANGSKGVLNGSKVVVNGTSIVKRDTASALVKTKKTGGSKELPPIEELKVLPSDEGFSWASNNYNSVQRSIDVWSFVLSLRVRVLFDNAKWSYIGGFTEDKQKNRRRRTASWLRECVLQLGPTFIKLGQLSSTRSDLFPREFVDELAKLQDRVPAFSPKKAKAFIANELGAPVDILFKEFEDQPIAAASLGQVHRAILHNGEKVVVKVQRPGLKKLFDIDLPGDLGLYRDQGIKINRTDMLDARGYSRSQIASRSIEAYLIQILRTGFFHADPHPGNLAIDVDESLIYYDFGMMGEIKSFTRQRLLDLFYAIYEKDAKKVMVSLIDLEALQPTGDLSSVRRSVQFFLDNLLSQSPDQQQTLAAIGEDLFAIAQDQPFRFPSTFTFVIRAFSTLEGIGYTLDPDFSFVKVAAPYAQELLDLKQKQRTGTQLVQEIRKQADDARTYTMSMPYRVQRIEEFVKQLESGDLKLRVRVLEIARSIIDSFSLCNQGTQVIANGSFAGAGVFLLLLIRSMQRVKKLDNFEKQI